MIIKGLAHIGIPTSDIVKSKKFYEELGFNTICNAPNMEGNNFLFMECNNVIIGLPQSLDESIRSKAGTKGAGDIDHFALYVDDIEETIKELKSKGIKFVNENIAVTEAWAPKKCRCIMVYGPDNVKIEFVEMK